MQVITVWCIHIKLSRVIAAWFIDIVFHVLYNISGEVNIRERLAAGEKLLKEMTLCEFAFNFM